MNTADAFQPNWASPPGDTVADVLRDRRLSESEFAHLMNQAEEDTRALLEGRATITIELARRLSKVLGASVEFWMTRDFQYRQDVARRNKVDQQWLSELPVSEMIKFGWITPVPHPSEEASACLRFFGVDSVPAWHERYGDLERMVAFRTSSSFDSRLGAVTAWIRQGEIQAEAIHCEAWNRQRFQDSLASIRSLTRQKDPSKFLPKLQEFCARSGVAVVITRAPSGCRASGATHFLSPQKALLQLSFRHLTDDHFWFSFFHEAGHLVLHPEKALFLEGSDTPLTSEEEEANQFAAEALVPKELQPDLSRLGANAQGIIRFSVRAGIAPGIVVGQLQHMGKLRHSQLNGLKRRFRWSE